MQATEPKKINNYLAVSLLQDVQSNAVNSFRMHGLRYAETKYFSRKEQIE